MEDDDEPSPKRKSFSVAERLEAVARLNQGESIKAVAAAICVAETTLRRWRRRSDEFSQVSRKANKSVRCANNEGMEKELYGWLVQRWLDKTPVTGPEIRGKALQINSDTGGPASFAGSEGWLSRFLQRHKIRLSGKIASTDATCDNPFVYQFLAEVQEEGYERDNIYNFDEIGVYYKALPSRSYVLPTSEKQRRGTKFPKDRLTVGVCANASGTHKIPLLVLGNSAKPRCFRSRREIDSLPVKYHYSKKAWMSQRMLMEYVEDIFIPSVEAKQLEEGRVDKVLFLVDNASSHNVLEEVEFGRVVVQFLPNTTTSIQPMEQGITAKLRWLYRRQLVDRLLNANVDILDFNKTLTVKDACSMLASAWEVISAETLQRSWNKLLPHIEPDNHVSSPTPSPDTTSEILTKMRMQEELTEALSDKEAMAWSHSIEKLEAVTEDPESDGLDDSSDEDDGVPMPRDPRQAAIEGWKAVESYLALQVVSPHTIEDVLKVLHGEDEPNTDVEPLTFVACKSEF